jgi:hypothetical protein
MTSHISAEHVHYLMIVFYQSLHLQINTKVILVDAER